MRKPDGCQKGEPAAPAIERRAVFELQKTTAFLTLSSGIWYHQRMKKSEIRLYEIGTATDLKKALLRLLEARSNNIDSEEKALARIESYSLDPAHFLALATAEDSAVGYIWMQNFGAHLRTGKSIARLHDIFVLPDYRRNGIATELFAAGKNWCVANQISYLQWKASQDATGFYQQLGLNGDTESDLAEYPFYEIQF